MAEADRVELAHEPDFVLGRLTVSPVRRALIREGGAQEVLEHRVMQVLIALAKARGGVVTRDELMQSCWQGRIVGEDAVNRVMSRLRKAAEAIGTDSFRVETVTKIGYRLIALDAEGKAVPAAGALPASTPGPRITRRAVVAGALALGGTGLAAGGSLLYRRLGEPAVLAEASALTIQGRIALAQGTREGANQAVGAFRRITEIAPDQADGWGLLAIAYVRASYFRPTNESDALVERGKAALRHALQQDPGNAYAILAQTTTLPQMGRWTEGERGLRRALAARPDDSLIQSVLGNFLNAVGRFEEALVYLQKQTRTARPPSEYYTLIQALWGAGRVEELDRMTAQAAALYPSQFALWFARFYILLYGGQFSAAIAMGEDMGNRPSGIDAEEFDALMAVARAARSGARSEIDSVMDEQFRRAGQGAGMAENAIQFACLFGRLDDAFTIADAYYFDRGFVVPDARFFGSQGSYSPRSARNTRFLFQPSTARMRTDPRFQGIVESIGMERYWREIGVQPDYRRRS
ncbi:MAG TPA: winged helix-turn-helix domain-containing protein [Sphingobium sp.]